MTRRLKIATAATLIAAGMGGGLAGISGEETPKAAKAQITADASTGGCSSSRYQHNRAVYLRMNERAEELRHETNGPQPVRGRAAALRQELASLAEQLC